MVEMSDIVNAEDGESVLEEKERLSDLFGSFRDENEPFNYNVVVKDEESFEVDILVDFSIENYEGGNYYVGNVTARKEQNISKTESEIRNSHAYQTAEEILEYGARTIHRERRLKPEWRSDEKYVESIYTIIWSIPE